jgi:hypothetical protein
MPYLLEAKIVLLSFEVGAHKRKLSLLFSWIDIIGLLKAEAI